ncbi:hypothetical protein EPA93_06840 [Ktedonosporobacter rubrisoli]|uniref:DUF6745 domain-containing protein n=1 Tax=Ktedonosporobacter rubrisoli TaxID=2509675 RepID=A0A4P6JKL9_KTERU|nr:hypothetical protein [Ktedonosporobacter rubrisoli]QBD75737.1 hypothetical protein EPA93_06840 [Ktedonosporobacter rubrisoli]
MEEMLGSMPPCPRIVRGQQSLTPQQEEYARHFAQERIARMLAPTVIDEQEAEAHLREAYRVAGLCPPVTIRWFDSPIPFLLACVKDNSEWGDVYQTMEIRVRTSTQDSLRKRVEKSLYEKVEACVYGEASMWNTQGASRYGIWTNVTEIIMWEIYQSVLDSVEATLWGNTRVSVGVNLRDITWANVEESVWGCQGLGDIVLLSLQAYNDAYWLAFFRFLHEVFEENKLIHWALFNELVSGYRLQSKEAWLVRKPILLECDEQGRLHSASGRCLQYRDGWGWYAWHGVRMPEKIILHPQQLTREDWLQEHNVEVRRVIQEQLGNDRFVELIGGKYIDTGTRGNLIEVDLGNDPEGVAHYVQVRDASTQRQYSLRVPPSIRRADEAIAWTFGLDSQDYQPRQET